MNATQWNALGFRITLLSLHLACDNATIIIAWLDILLDLIEHPTVP